MSVPVPVLAAARPAPRLRVAEPTLAATMPTAMVLVDYALNGKTMPSAELHALAEGLPAELADASWPIRAAMAHGTVLRSVLLHQLPADHPGHTDWARLRRWMAAWSDDFVNGVIDFGVDSVMSYGKPPREPIRTAARIESLAGPSAAVRRNAAQVLRWWEVPRPRERGRELLDPRTFRSVLLELLDAIWDGWLERAWTESLPAMRATVAATPAPPPGCSGVQWISLVTGLRPDDPYAAAADSATELVVLPTPGLGRSLSLFADQLTWVVFTPQQDQTPKRTGISVSRLAALAPVMRALGDRTRLALTLHLLEHGPMSMQQLADALEVHQSTVSRQVNALREAGVVRIQDDRRVVAVSGVVRQACQTLLTAVD